MVVGFLGGGNEVGLSLGCIPKSGFVSYLEVAKKFLWWVGWWGVVGG